MHDDVFRAHKGLRVSVFDDALTKLIATVVGIYEFKRIYLFFLKQEGEDKGLEYRAGLVCVFCRGRI